MALQPLSPSFLAFPKDNSAASGMNSAARGIYSNGSHSRSSDSCEASSRTVHMRTDSGGRGSPTWIKDPSSDAGTFSHAVLVMFLKQSEREINQHMKIPAL